MRAVVLVLVAIALLAATVATWLSDLVPASPPPREEGRIDDDAPGLDAVGPAPPPGAGAGPTLPEEPPPPVRVRRVLEESRTVQPRNPLLAWLDRQQNPDDGSWEDSPLTTGLVLLAYLGAGETPKRGAHRRQVWNGLVYLKRIQNPRGRFETRDTTDPLTAHAIATLAMCEAYGITPSPFFKQSAQSAIDCLEQAGAPGTSAAIWSVMALWSAKAAGLDVTPESLENGWRTLEAETYSPLPPKTEASLFAARIFCRILAGEDPRESAEIREGVEWLLANALPAWEEGRENRIDLMAWYFGTLTIFRAGGDAWKKWSKALQEAVRNRQVIEGPEKGSWDPAGPAGWELGRTGTTAILAMCLEIHYRYANVYGNR